MPTPKGTSDELFLTHPGGPEDSELTKVIYSILDNSGESSAAWLMFMAQANLHENGKSFTGSRFMPENIASLGCSQSYSLSRDLEIMARHVQALENFRNAKELEPFFKFNGKRNHLDAFNIGSLEGANKYVLDTGTTSYHSCGTAAMLPKDRGGSIDGELLVHGVSNLRIVDASIFPMITRGNPIATVYAVAEKAADIIKNY
ncbi:glucose-methanol-choline oxidoreductase [Fusarium sp. NRRL 25303]|nr:glucose-methanol-choline oxidoreductase [Fusarium sp. NRRL 25303]